MKNLLLLFTVCFFFNSSIFAQSDNFKIEETDGKTFKVYYNIENIKYLKEEVYVLDNPTNENKYRSLDFYEKFNDNGNIIFKGNKINGNHVEFYDNGKKMIQGAVMNSKKEGRWVFFNQEEQIVKVDIYRSGELIDSIEY